MTDARILIEPVPGPGADHQAGDSAGSDGAPSAERVVDEARDPDRSDHGSESLAPVIDLLERRRVGDGFVAGAASARVGGRVGPSRPGVVEFRSFDAVDRVDLRSSTPDLLPARRERGRSRAAGARVDIAMVDEDRAGEAPHDAVTEVPSRPLDRSLRWAAGVLGAVAVVGFGILAAWWGPLVAMLAIAVGGVTALATYRLVGRPWQLSWGATEAEVASAMPGDELFDVASAVTLSDSSADRQERAESAAASVRVTTRAISIDAPVAQVWDWLIARGLGAAGWCGAERCGDEPGQIVPVLGDLGAGDARLLGPQFEVVHVEAPSSLISRRADGAAWCLHLAECGPGRSRLVSRYGSPTGSGSSGMVGELDGFLTERRTLRAIRALAEAGAPLIEDRPCPCAP